jgi:ribosomal protein S18 acetylase RimI-like enzyme
VADRDPQPTPATAGQPSHGEHVAIARNGGVQFRRAGTHDAGPVAALHADSWRRNYRGAYADTFLDGDVVTERLAFWTARLREQPADRFAIVAEEAGSLVGFAYSILDENPTWGAYLDNLHVAHTHQRQGIGTRLMALTAEAVIEQRPSSGLSLWVLEQNVRAQRFYEARGGRRVGRDRLHPPGGDPSRLRGEVYKLRYAWPDPATLLITG